MAANVEVSEPLAQIILDIAAAEQLTPEQFLQKLVDEHLENKSWREIVARGRSKSEALRYTESDVDRLIHEHRAHKRNSQN